MCAMAARSELATSGGLVQEGRKRGVWNILQSSCEREEERMLQLMMGHVDRPPAPPLLLQDLAQSMERGSTLDLALGSKGLASLFNVQSSGDMHLSSSPGLELDSQSTLPLPSGWEKCLDLQTGSIYYLNRSTGLSTSCDPRMKLPFTPINWAPTSPSSASDLTFEGVPSSSASKHPATSNPPVNALEGSSAAAEDIDLSLSLRVCSSLPKRPPLSNHRHSQTLSDRGNKGFSIDSKPAANHHVSSIFKQSADMAPTSVSSVCTSPRAQLEEILGSMGRRVQQRKPHSTDVLRSNISMDEDVLSATSSSSYNSSMITVGCANCLMFVMLPQSCKPKCPRCGASIDTTELPQPGPFKRAKLDLSHLF